MAAHILRQIRAAVKHLHPDEVRELADRPPHIGLRASSEAGYGLMADFLLPQVSRARRLGARQFLHRAGERGGCERFEIEIHEEGFSRLSGAFTFRRHDPGFMVAQIIEQHKDLSLALARHFPPFRKPVIERTIQTVSRENAMFAVLSALPNVVPTIFEFPWAVGEFVSDTSVLTMNQIRMAFLIAAASDHRVGYLEQKAQIASIIAGAFGWRALARELAGKIPLGAGLIPKGAIAYAGTYVVGAALERFYRIGYALTREERRRMYEEGFERGKTLLTAVLSRREAEHGT